MKILVGSENPVKISAVKKAFKKYFGELSVIGISVPSGVPEQPVNEDTFAGAENRARNLFVINKEKNLAADYFVGIEGGIIEIFNNWFGFGCMCVLDKSGRKSFGTSPHFPLPDFMVEQMLAGKELGDIMDEESGEVNTKQNQGAIGIFTNGIMDREDLYVYGLIPAVIPFINKDKFSLK